MMKTNSTCMHVTKLPLQLNSVLIGIMLSDGSLYKSSPNANVRFEMSFGEKYKELAFHIGELFHEYMSNPVKSLEVKGVNKNYINYRLKTKTLSIFKILRVSTRIDIFFFTPTFSLSIMRLYFKLQHFTFN